MRRDWVECCVPIRWLLRHAALLQHKSRIGGRDNANNSRCLRLDIDVDTVRPCEARLLNIVRAEYYMFPPRSACEGIPMEINRG
jgi:hypothetical protein